MLRWSLTYVLVIMLLMAGAATGWMVFSTRQATHEMEALVSSVSGLKQNLAEARTKLREAHSNTRDSQTKLRKSLANLEQEKTAREDARAELIKIQAINKVLVSQLKSAKLALLNNSERAKDNTVTPTQATAVQLSSGRRQNDDSNSSAAPPSVSTATPSGFLGDLALAAKGVTLSADTDASASPGAGTNADSSKPKPAPNQPTPAIAAPVKVESRTINNRLNVRAAPTVTATLVVTLTPGQKIKVSTSGAPNGWHKLIGPSGLKGFIKTTALRANSN